MNCIGYFRGTHANELRARLNEYALDHGLELVGIYSDDPGEYTAFRELQTAVKIGLCDIVLLPSYDSLADDRYLMLENRLFLLRNGVLPVFINKAGFDNRHEIVLNISRYFGYISDWDSSYGISMPLRNTFSEFKRIPPIGYKVVGGEAVSDQSEAAAVREIFARYASGEQLKDIYKKVGEKYGFGDSLGNMTVKTILKNERYLGRMSKKGYHLPPIIRYDEWLAAKERLEHEYGTVKGNEPFIAISSSDVPIAFYRSSKQKKAVQSLNRPKNTLFIDTEKFENEIASIIDSICTEENALALYNEHVLAERKRASAAIPKAEAMLCSINRAVYNDIALIKKGDCSDEVQDRLEKNNAIRVFNAMRMRRIRSEATLYSIGKEQVTRFFERARNLRCLSLEEKSFIAETFISSVFVRSGKIRIVFRDPLSPKRRAVIINDCISD